MKPIVLLHPQSSDLISDDSFTESSAPTRIACGTAKVPQADLSEAGDFFPTYAAWNSSLFETSVILTVWEHADELIGSDNVAFLHSDVRLHFSAAETWEKLDKHLREEPDGSVALTVPKDYQGIWDEWLVPETAKLIPECDPYHLHSFDNGIQVWDYIKRVDRDLHEWAFESQPNMIYSHQFACTRETFDYLGDKLHRAARSLRLGEIGFWTPHVFERLIALYLAKRGKPILTTAFWHYQSSGVYGPGDHSLYGPRPFRHYKIRSRTS